MRARPYFQQLYASRVTLYRDALQQFLQGYREGFSAEQGRSSFTEPGKRLWEHCTGCRLPSESPANLLWRVVMTANMPLLLSAATKLRWRAWCRT